MKNWENFPRNPDLKISQSSLEEKVTTLSMPDKDKNEDLPGEASSSNCYYDSKTAILSLRLRNRSG
jgi:hypothetical protein